MVQSDTLAGGVGRSGGSGGSGKWIVLGILGAMVLGAVILVSKGISSYNGLVALNESIDGSWAQVENVLQRRYDLIPNLVNTVKGYAKHERGLLTEITKLRSQWGKAQTAVGKRAAATGLEGALSRLMVVMENYPNLKANQGFLKLQDELSGTENRIAVERKRYNDVVRAYNILVRRFPSNIIAGHYGFEKRDEYFEVEEVAKKVPKVNF